MRLVGWAEKGNRLVSHPPVVVENQSAKISRLWRSPLRSKGFQPLIGLLSLEHQCREKESLQQLAVKISRNSNWVRQRAAKNPDILLKSTSTDLLDHTHPKLQCWGTSNKNSRGI